MSCITISRGSYSYGKEIAEKVAARLHYECVERDALLDASETFNIPEIKLVEAIRDAPSILGRFTYGKERYISYIQAALLNRMQKDNIVYHGLAGHFFLKNISHVLKVRIIADLEDRIANKMKLEGHLSREAAQRLIKKDDEERIKWSQHLYGIDTRDSSLYDLVVHIKIITVENAVDIICDTARLERFQTTPESQQAMNDLVTAASVKAALVQSVPDVNVSCSQGKVQVSFHDRKYSKDSINGEIEKITKTIKGIEKIEIRVHSIRDIE
ncbi:MAG: cytidylate kinase-like family protein [Candidatus Deferrimicrobiaceae bacterium]